MKLTLKKFSFDEKRNVKRAPIEMPVVFLVVGEKPKREIYGVIQRPSQTGVGIHSSENIPEGAVLEMIAFIDKLGGGKPCRLRGNVVWSRSKVGTLLFHSGVRLDPRSKDIKRWQNFILERLRSLELI